MEILNRFTETVFLKESSDLERQIEELKSLPSWQNRSDIIKEVKLLQAGLAGEREIEYELKNCNFGLVVLHDINLVYEDLSAQIDYIIISKGFAYLVECKNLIGNITVDQQGEFRRDVTINGIRYKEAIYSPYTQAVRHKEILKKKWMKKNNRLFTFLQSNNFDNLWYKPLVVLSNSKSLLDTRYAPKEIKKNIIRVDQLVRTIQNDLNEYDRNLMMNKKEMLEFGNDLLKAHSEKRSSFAERYKKQTREETLRNELIYFRKQRSDEMKIPAYYIFTNQELEEIIKNKPVTAADLSHILPEIKVRIHGALIIEILRKLTDS